MHSIPHTIYLQLADFVLKSSSVQAESINRLHGYFFIAAAFIFTVVTAFTVFVVVKFRHKPEDAGKEYTPKQLNPKWEYAMIGVPTAMVILFFFLMLHTMNRVLPSTDNQQPDVVITGHQFWWEAQYPKQGVTAANEIHLPVGKKLLLKLVSADVIHDWWVPQFGNKMDLISGKENYLWVNITKAGKYEGNCSEFCGAQHAGMFINVYADTDDDFKKWISLHQQKATPSIQPLAVQGAKLFQEKACGGCHAIEGTTALGRAGPNLTHIASRNTLLTGLLQNNSDNLRRWLANPQQIKPGANMPNFLLDKQELNELVAYLSSLH